MPSGNSRRVIAEITAQQWGMVTSAQAGELGVTRLVLSRFTKAGYLKRQAHGVYMDPGTPASQFDDLRAAWLSTDPTRRGFERIKDGADGVVVASASAAWLHGIGDLWADRHDFVCPIRRQSQRPEVRYRQRMLDPRDVTLVEGLPVMTVERTIADLVEVVGDLSLVAGALRDAWLKGAVDLARLRDLLSPLAARRGFKKDDGTALLARLQEIAGIDLDTVARRVAANAPLGSRVVSDYVGSLTEADFDSIGKTPEMQEAMRSIQDGIAATLRAGLWEQWIAAHATTEPVRGVNPTMNADLLNLVAKVSEQLTGMTTMMKLSQAWAKSLGSNTAVGADVRAASLEVQRALADA